MYAHCPVCGSEKIEYSLKASDHTVSGEAFEIWTCQHCSCRFTQAVPRAGDIGPYYAAESYISHSDTRKGLINQLYQWVRRITLYLKKALIEKTTGKKKGNILDVGCGTGAFLTTMQGAGWEVLGLEPDEGARNKAMESGVPVDRAEALFDLAGKQFDAITLWHVLEHVHELHTYLDTLARILKPGGKLFIAVPNYTASDANHYREMWAAYDVPRHLYHFTPAAMAQLLRQHGFQLESQRAMPFDGFYVSLLSEKYKYGKVRLLAGFLQGLRSWMGALRDPGKASAVLYIGSHLPDK